MLLALESKASAISPRAVNEAFDGRIYWGLFYE